MVAPTAFASPKIKIGVIGPMKFVAGQNHWWGALLAAEEINAAGGVMVGREKHEIELLKTDSNEMQNLTDAVSSMERIIKVDKVHFITGGFRTEAVLAMQDVAADHKRIFLGGSGSPGVTERLAKNYDRYKYFFRALSPVAVYFTQVNLFLLEMAGDKMKAELGITKPRVALVLDKIVVADPIVTFAQDMLPKMGMEIAGVWRTSPMANDLTSELTAIKAADAHLILTFLSGPSGAIFNKQWGELRIPAAPVGYNAEANALAHLQATGGMCDYVSIWGTFGGVKITDKTVPFFNKFIARAGEYPLSNAATYDAVYLLKEAIQRSKTLEVEAVIRELEKIEYRGASGIMAFYPRDHKWPHDLKTGPGYTTMLGLQWRDGKLVTVWPDGRAALGDKEWVGIKYEGTVDYNLPPWMITYWKKKK
jgi:branched-chain amino acid transport system substrate-binding protein